MFTSILVVCVGNVCRSPVGERILAQACPDLRVESAGINALVDWSVDETAAQIATENGISVAGHKARQFTREIASDFDLILALETGHIQVVAQQVPEARGKTMLYGQWLNKLEIPDPYRKSREFHSAVFDQLRAASEGWVTKLGCS